MGCRIRAWVWPTSNIDPWPAPPSHILPAISFVKNRSASYGGALGKLPLDHVSGLVKGQPKQVSVRIPQKRIASFFDLTWSLKRDPETPWDILCFENTLPLRKGCFLVQQKPNNISLQHGPFFWNQAKSQNPLKKWLSLQAPMKLHPCPLKSTYSKPSGCRAWRWGWHEHAMEIS